MAGTHVVEFGEEFRCPAQVGNASEDPACGPLGVDVGSGEAFVVGRGHSAGSQQRVLVRVEDIPRLPPGEELFNGSRCAQGGPDGLRKALREGRDTGGVD